MTIIYHTVPYQLLWLTVSICRFNFLYLYIYILFLCNHLLSSISSLALVFFLVRWCFLCFNLNNVCLFFVWVQRLIIASCYLGWFNQPVNKPTSNQSFLLRESTGNIWQHTFFSRYIYSDSWLFVPLDFVFVYIYIYIHIKKCHLMDMNLISRNQTITSYILNEH